VGSPEALKLISFVLIKSMDSYYLLFRREGSWRTAMKVLLVEDDRELAESLVDYLARHGIEVDWLEDDRVVEDRLKFYSYDAMILDLMLRYRKGEEILKGLRTIGVDIPVLVLTAKRRIDDKEVCFDLGADDYLTKPFDPKELVLRLRVLHRREKKAQMVDINGFKMDIDKQILYDGEGREVSLSNRMKDVLYLLAKNKGRLVPKEQILSYVWGDEIVNEEIVRAYIKALRKMLPDGSIETVKGRGYRLR